MLDWVKEEDEGENEEEKMGEKEKEEEMEREGWTEECCPGTRAMTWSKIWPLVAYLQLITAVISFLYPKK